MHNSLHQVGRRNSWVQFHLRPAGCALSLHGLEPCDYERLLKEVNGDKALFWAFAECVWDEWICKQADNLIGIHKLLVLAQKNTLSK